MLSICHVSPSTTWYTTSLIMPAGSLFRDGVPKERKVGQGKERTTWLGGVTFFYEPTL